MKTYVWLMATAALLTWNTGCDEPPQTPDEQRLPDDTVQPIPPRTGSVDPDASRQELYSQSGGQVEPARSTDPDSTGRSPGVLGADEPREQPSFEQTFDGAGGEEAEGSSPFVRPSASAPQSPDPFAESPTRNAGSADTAAGATPSIPEVGSDSPRSLSDEAPGEPEGFTAPDQQDVSELDEVEEFPAGE